MKKYVVFIISLLVLIMPSFVLAATYKKDMNGHYYVSGAKCTYLGDPNFVGEENSYYTIIIKDHSLKEITSSIVEEKKANGQSWATFTYRTPGLTYPNDFFVGAEFTCPQEIYYDPLSVSHGGGTSFYKSCTKDVTGGCEDPNLYKMTYVASKSSRESYIEEETPTSSSKNQKVKCSFKKITSSSSTAQYKAVSALYYISYTDNTYALFDGSNHELNMASDSKVIDDCATYDAVNSDIYVKVTYSNNEITSYKISDSKCSDTGDGLCVIYRLEKYYNSQIDDSLEADGSSTNEADKVAPSDIQVLDPEIKQFSDCESLLGDPETQGTPAYYLVIAFNVVKYVAIIILIVLSVLDFITAIASSDQDIIMKTTKKVIMRVILCVVIFLLPTLIKVALAYLSDRAADLCGIN